MTTDGLLPNETLRDLHGAVVSAGLDRDALLEHIDRRLVAGIRKVSSLSAQVLVDLAALNEIQALSDGSVPLRTWLENARDLAEPRAEVAIFQRALDALGGGAPPAKRAAPAASMERAPFAAGRSERTTGRLHGVPELPPHFLPRPDDLHKLRALLLEGRGKAVGVTGRARRAGVQGMGGIGKSVLAAALARDEAVRDAFPEGVFWVTLGQTPSLVSLQTDLCRALGAKDEVLDNERHGRALSEHSSASGVGLPLPNLVGATVAA